MASCEPSRGWSLTTSWCWVNRSFITLGSLWVPKQKNLGQPKGHTGTVQREQNRENWSGGPETCWVGTKVTRENSSKRSYSSEDVRTPLETWWKPWRLLPRKLHMCVSAHVRVHIHNNIRGSVGFRFWTPALILLSRNSLIDQLTPKGKYKEVYLNKDS